MFEKFSIFKFAMRLLHIHHLYISLKWILFTIFCSSMNIGFHILAQIGLALLDFESLLYPIFTFAVFQVKVDMGQPVLSALDVPTKLPANNNGAAIRAELIVDGLTWNVTCVSMGNPHCVTFGTKNTEVIFFFLKKHMLIMYGRSFSCYIQK